MNDQPKSKAQMLQFGADVDNQIQTIITELFLELIDELLDVGFVFTPIPKGDVFQLDFTQVSDHEAFMQWHYRDGGLGIEGRNMRTLKGYFTLNGELLPKKQAEGMSAQTPFDKIGFGIHNAKPRFGSVQALSGFPEFLLGHVPNSFTFDCALLPTGELHANTSNWLEVSTRDGGWQQITPGDQDLKVLEDYLKTIGFVEQMFKRFPEGMWLELKSMVFSFTGTAGNNFVLYQHLLHERFLRIDL